MKKDSKNIINTSVLLSWLYSADKDLAIEDLGRWIEARTNGQYVLVKKDIETTRGI